MAGITLQEQGFISEMIPNFYSVKEAVFPFAKFPGVDPILGPEMKSTGEVMGIGDTFGEAFRKASLGAGERLPTKGRAFISVREVDKPLAASIGRQLVELGFSLVATRGTARVLEEAGVPVEHINKVKEGRPHIVDRIKNRDIDLIINTTEGVLAIADSFAIRREALQNKVSYTTTIAGADAICKALQDKAEMRVRRLQDLHKGLVL
jgi:carbamoyl-phosphate synthase large subunit